MYFDIIILMFALGRLVRFPCSTRIRTGLSWKGLIITFANPVIKEIVDWIVHIAIAIAIGLFIVIFIAQRTVVEGNSMLPTLQNGNNLIVEKISPKLGRLYKNDIITINDPEHISKERNPIIKRVVAVEGDVVEIKDGKVYVNNTPLNESYINGNTTLPGNTEYSRATIQKDYVYVLGDNRMPGQSIDSRFIGPVSLKKVEGKVLVRVLPLNEMGKVR